MQNAGLGFLRSIFCISILCATVPATYASSRTHEPSTTGGDISVITTSPYRGTTRMQFANPRVSREEVTAGGERFTDVWIEGENSTLETGLPSLPVVNRLIGIPDHGAVQLRILSSQYTELSGVRALPFQGLESESQPSSDEFHQDQDFYRQNVWYPPEIAVLGEPAVLRDVRIVTVSIRPVQYNPATGTLRIYSNIDVQVEPVPGAGINEKVRAFDHPSSAFMPMYRQLENFEYLGLDEETALPGTYLIICHDHPSPIGYAQQLAEWKQRKGIPTRIATLTETGSSSTEIRSYIQNAYNTWESPPEFLCMLGDHFDPANPFHVPANPGIFNDDEYGRVAGNDMLADIAIGRLSAMDAGSMEYVVAKTIRYEQNPFTSVDWFTKAYLIAGTSFNITSNVSTMEHIRWKMYDRGFSEVVLHTSGGPISEPLFRQQINLGRAFFFHRPGWTGEIGAGVLTGLSNGWMLPFAYTLTCGSGPFAGTTGFGEAFLRYGSMANGGGCIGCIGSTTSGTHTRFNNLLAAAIADNFTVNDVQEAGLALMEGKFQMFRQYVPQETSTIDNYYCKNFNLMGDPAVRIWTEFPASFQVSYPSEFPLGSNRVPVAVQNSQGDPVEGALVCLMKGDETWTRAYTDASGSLEMTANPVTEGILWITVSKKNYLNYTRDITVTQQPLYLGYVSALIDDDNTGGTSGNGDGMLNPGETVDLTITAHNFGSSQTATGVSGMLSSLDDRVAQVLVNLQTFPNIGSGGEAASAGAYRVAISPGVQDQSVTPLRLTLTSSGGQDTSLVPLTVVSGDAMAGGCQFLVSNNRLDPGETEQMVVTIANMGHLGMSSVVGHAFSLDPLISFPQPTASFGNIPVDSVSRNLATPFLIMADPATFPGHHTSVGTRLTGDDGFVDTVYFNIAVGQARQDDPAGPDNYGYYCFDDLDSSYEQAPEFNWIEIDPAFGGSGQVLPLNDYGENQDASVVVHLPFVFRMYGVLYDSITICSNGWAAMGNQLAFHDFENYMIPGPQGPNAMLAPFWQELVLGSGHVCCHYIPDDSIFVIEWSRVNIRSDAAVQTFQIVLCDENRYPTSSGDGLIGFQYLEIHNFEGPYATNSFATVGIEDHTQTDGIQLSYWGFYGSGVAPLDQHRVYLFLPLDAGAAGPDSTGPSITHIPLTDTIDPVGPYQVAATIYDISRVGYADLHHSINGISYVVDPMSNPSGNQWLGSISGQSPGTTVRYFISAQDTLGNYAQTDTFSFSIWQIYLTEDFESGAQGWTHYNAPGWRDQWHLSEEDAHSATHSWKCGDPGEGNYADSMDAYLESPEIDIPANAVLLFYHRIQSERSASSPDSAYDGGVLEAYFDSGPWEQLFPQEGGYNEFIRYTSGGGNPYTGPFEGGTHVWADTIQWSRVVVDVSGHEGPFRIRFRFGSDAVVGLEGWYVDDVAIVGLPPSGFAANSNPIPSEFSLGQNYPNPFNPVTSIPYSLRESAHVTLTLYNVLGQKVATLVDQRQDAGYHRAVFDAASFSSGIYFFELKAGSFSRTRKMVLLK